MRAMRILALAGAVLLAAACSSEGLTDEERTWCLANENAVLNVFGAEYAGDPMMETITEDFVESISTGITSVGEFLLETYPDEYAASCRTAFADR